MDSWAEWARWMLLIFWTALMVDMVASRWQKHAYEAAKEMMNDGR